VLSGWPLLTKRAASGGDRIRARAYGSRLHDHVTSRVERVKHQCSRAKWLRRHSIPQGHGALRPLGIPATEDNVLQMAGARLLEAMYAPDFLPSRYGSRQKIGAREAVRDLTRHRQGGPYSSVGEADLTGDFDPIDHERLREMLRVRREDRPCLRRIEPWGKAGG
jgi:RNA-directed DNA polymerase